MTVSDTIATLQLAISQMQLLQGQTSTATSGSTADPTRFTALLDTATAAVTDAMKSLSVSESGAGTVTRTTAVATAASHTATTPAYETFKAESRNHMLVEELGNRGPSTEAGLWAIYANSYGIPLDQNPYAAAAQAEMAAYNNRFIVPQKGANGYYNQDTKPADPVAPTDIYSVGSAERKAAYENDQLALAIWQQKEISLANLARRQSGAYGEGGMLGAQVGTGDWQSEFNMRIQAMRDQGLAVDTYLSNVTMV